MLDTNGAWKDIYNANSRLLAPHYLGDSMALKVGDPAPDFELAAVSGERQHKVRLSEYRGKQNVVITFHPLDWTPT